MAWNCEPKIGWGVFIAWAFFWRRCVSVATASFAVGVAAAMMLKKSYTATGSVFELAYGDPDLGVATTRLILGLALPGTILSLLVAIRINKPT